MAKKLRVQPDRAEKNPSEPRSRKSRRASKGLWFALTVVSVSAAALGGIETARLWQSHTFKTRVATALPPKPDFSNRPAALGEAWSRLDQQIRSGQGGWEVLANLARLYQANNYTAEAHRVWLIARAEAPTQPEPAYYLAALARDSGDDAEARNWLEETTHLAPNYAPAWLERAELALKAGQLDAAEKAYRKNLELEPGNPYARLGLARIALDRGARDVAKNELETITTDDPQFPSAHNLLAEMLEESGDAAGAARQRWLGTAAGKFHEAEDPWMESLRAFCFDPARLVAWATMERQTQHGDRGRSLIERAGDLAPDSAEIQGALGDWYLNSGYVPRARIVLERAVRLVSPPVKIYSDLSEAQRTQGDFAAAVATAEDGLKKFPDTSELYTSLGLAHEGAHQLADAIDAFAHAIKLSPEAPLPAVDLASALVSAGRRDEAYAALHHALEAQPQFPPAVELLGRMELQDGHWELAEENLRVFYAAYPGSTAARELMARCCLQKGLAAARAEHFPAAEAALREGISIASDLPELSASLGTIFLQEQKWRDALAPLAEFHRLRPNDPRACLLLAEAHQHLGERVAAITLAQDAVALAEQSNDSETRTRAEGLLDALR